MLESKTVKIRCKNIKDVIKVTNRMREWGKSYKIDTIRGKKQGKTFMVTVYKQ